MLLRVGISIFWCLKANNECNTHLMLAVPDWCDHTFNGPKVPQGSAQEV